MKLAPKLVTLFLLFLIISLASLGFLAYDNGRQSIEQDTLDRLATVTTLKEAEFTRWLRGNQQNLRTIAGRPSVGEYAAVLAALEPTDPTYQAAQSSLLNEHLVLTLEEETSFLDLSILRPSDGMILISSDEMLEGKYRESEPFFLEGKQHTYVQNPVYSVSQGLVVMHVSTPIQDQTGNLIAVLAGRLDSTEMSEIMLQHSGIRETQETYLVNAFNFLITESRFEPDYALKKAIHTVGVGNCLEHNDGSGFYDDYRGVPVIGVYRWMPEWELCILTEIDQDEAFASIQALRNKVIGWGVVVALITSVLMVLIIRRVLHPIEGLSVTAEAIRAGDLSRRAEVNRKDELGMLASTFNSMAAQLQEIIGSLEQRVAARTQELTAANAQLAIFRRLADSAGQGFSMSTLEGEITYANPSLCHLLDADGPADVIGQSFFSYTDARLRQQLQSEILPAVLQEMQWAGEIELRSSTGQMIPTLNSIFVIPDEASNPLYLANVITDITERKQAEEALRQSQRELGIRNKIAEIFLTIPYEDMYTEVLQIILEAMDSQYGVFGYIDEQGALVVPTMTRHIWSKCQVPDKNIVFPRKTWGDSTWPRAIREKQTIYTNEPSTNTPEGHVAVCRHISQPLIHHGEVLGLLQVANKETDYEEKDLSLLETISRTIAPVLDARLQRDRWDKQRKQAEGELARSNTELEQFAYVASHDLQEPLRVVTSYLQLLERRYTGQLDESAQKFILRSVEAAARMKTLINDLLAYSRVNTRGNPFAPTDMATVMEQTLENLQVAIKESHVVITHDTMPTIRTDANQLAQLLQNLIGNAIKFQGEEPPRVHVGAERQGDRWLFSVRDNGIGMEPEYSERIFVIFQRLHTREEYSGTGIGLAICQKIVERHGGRIWVEAQPGQGSTFYFTISDQGETI